MLRPVVFLLLNYYSSDVAKSQFESYIYLNMAETSNPGKTEFDPVENKIDPVRQVENLYFALKANVTIEAKNIIWRCLDTAKEYYPKTLYKEDWTRMLSALQDIINDFENQMSEQAELKLHALQKNLEELTNKEKSK